MSDEAEEAARVEAARLAADQLAAQRREEQELTETQARVRETASQIIANPDRGEQGKRVMESSGELLPLTEGPNLNIDELRRVGEEMRRQGKPFLSNDDIDGMVSAMREQEERKKFSGVDIAAGVVGLATLAGAGAAGAAGAVTAKTEEAAATLAPGVYRMVEGKDGTLKKEIDDIYARADQLQAQLSPGEERQNRRGALNPRVMNEVEIHNRYMTEPVDDKAKGELKRMALDACVNISDRGDAIAAGRLMHAVERNYSTQEIAGALLALEKAKHSRDINIRLRNGKTVSIANDGDATPEITVTEGTPSESQSYSVPASSVYMAPLFSRPLARQGRELGGREGILRDSFGGGLLQASYRPDNEGLSPAPIMRVSLAPETLALLGGKDMGMTDPFKITALETPGGGQRNRGPSLPGFA